METGRIYALCVSEARGTPKHSVPRVRLTRAWGVEGDAHGGDWHRQVSLLSQRSVDAFNALGAGAEPGAFGENILIEGIDVQALPVGARLQLGGARVKVTQIGKACHAHCAIYHRMGDCIMPRDGVFARVIEDGDAAVGDEARVLPDEPRLPRAAVVTLSYTAARGERADESGPLLVHMLEEAGWAVEAALLLSDERDGIEQALIDLSDRRRVDAVFTTGGTGFAPRDVTPEATLKVADRPAPGIAEALRAHSMAITPRAMFSRAAAAIRGKTLSVNLPGSPRAVGEQMAYLLPLLPHAIETLRGDTSECARK
ncbi:MAG: molybdopterin-binding protein [Eubacteriales bacterium]|nr:molybdopterin-binding protein [Eubacteriales bacterium]